MKYQDGDIIILEDGKEYIIVYQLIVGKNHYGLLLSDDGEHPIIKIGTFYTHDKACFFLTIDSLILR